MSSLNFDCPAPTALTDITKPTCAEKFGQIQRIGFRLVQVAEATFTTLDKLTDRSVWTSAMANDDRTKITISPMIASLIIPPGSFVKEEGGNNNTINGIAALQGQANIVVTGRFLNLSNEIAKLLRKLTVHSAITPGMTDLEIFLFNEFKQIICKKVDAEVPYCKGFNAYNFTVGSVGSEGLLKSNIHPMELELDGDWDESIYIGHPMDLDVDPWNPLELWPA